MKITLDFVEKLRTERLIDMRARMAEHEELVLILAEFEGKPLSKRLKLGRFRLIDGDIYGEYRHFIHNPLKASSFKSSNSPNWQPETIKKLEALDVEKVARVFGEIETHFEAIRDLFGTIERENLGHYHNDLYYTLLRTISDEDAPRHTAVNLSNFYYIRTKE